MHIVFHFREDRGCFTKLADRHLNSNRQIANQIIGRNYALEDPFNSLDVCMTAYAGLSPKW